jgi:hypothetical protein
MQYKLRTLFVVVSLAAIGCGVAPATWKWFQEYRIARYVQGEIDIAIACDDSVVGERTLDLKVTRELIQRSPLLSPRRRAALGSRVDDAIDQLNGRALAPVCVRVVADE